MEFLHFIIDLTQEIISENTGIKKELQFFSVMEVILEAVENCE